MPISVVLVDDHAVVRDGLHALLSAQPDMRVVGSFGNVADALRYCGETPPDVALLDIALPGLDGIEAAKRIHDLYPETHILMLSMHDSPEHVFQALRAGAIGYVLKESAGDEVVAAVRTLHAGRRYLSEKISPLAIEDYLLKLGIDDLPGLVKFAIRHGITSV